MSSRAPGQAPATDQTLVDGGPVSSPAPALAQTLSPSPAEGRRTLVSAQRLAGSGAWTAGTLVSGRYRLLQTLGRGGMGDVLLADDLFLRRKVAIKTLHKDMAADPQAAECFRAEVAMAHTLSHPGLARTYDLGEEAGVTYLTMEYLDGVTLAQRLEEEGPLAIDEAVRVALQAAAALDAAHQAGIIHRDIKPSNIMLVPGRGAVILDFGVAAAADEATGANGVHLSGSHSELIRSTSSAAGTPKYMAPEQWRGEPQGVATDIYAFGGVLFEALTGRAPFLATNRQAMMCAHLEEKPPALRTLRPEVPARLERLVADCLEKDPARRPASLVEVGRRLVVRRLSERLATASLALACLVACLAAAGALWWVGSSLLLREMRPAVQRLAENLAMRIDGAALAAVKGPADLKSEAFEKVLAPMRQTRQDNPEVAYIYAMRLETPPTGWIQLVDIDYEEFDQNGDGVIQENEQGVTPGDPWDSTGYPRLFEAYKTNRPQADDEFADTIWGLLLAGYAPVATPDREHFYVVGIDVRNGPLLTLRNTLFGVFLVLGLGGAVLVLVVRRRAAQTLPGFIRSA